MHDTPCIIMQIIGNHLRFVITGFPLDLDDHKNKWSCHRSFLDGCDRSPRMCVLKLGIGIPNLNTN